MPAIPTTPPFSAPSVGPKRALLVSTAGVVVIALALYLFWPVGVVLGLTLGVLIVLALGGQQERAARAVPQADAFSVFAPLGLGPASTPRALPAARVPLAIDAAPPAPAAASPARTVVAESQRTSGPKPVVVARPAAAPAPVAQRVTAAAAPTAVAAPAPTPRAPAVRPEITTAPPRPREDRGVRADLDLLKDELGDHYPDFARAARLVVSTQYASAARLQRDLHLPYARARRLLADLESQHFVGPATGTLPRQVLLPKERLPEVERLFAGV